jgi:hypothetical protein
MFLFINDNKYFLHFDIKILLSKKFIFYFILIINIKTFFDLSKKNKEFTIKQINNIFNNYLYRTYYNTKRLILNVII